MCVQRRPRSVRVWRRGGVGLLLLLLLSTSRLVWRRVEPGCLLMGGWRSRHVGRDVMAAVVLLDMGRRRAERRWVVHRLMVRRRGRQTARLVRVAPDEWRRIRVASILLKGSVPPCRPPLSLRMMRRGRWQVRSWRVRRVTPMDLVGCASPAGERSRRPRTLALGHLGSRDRSSVHRRLPL